MANTTDQNPLYETTVYNLFSVLKENNLTNKGYFDLEKVPYLRVINNGLLETIRKRYGKTNQELANILGIPLRTVLGWQYYSKAIPMSKLVALQQKLGLEKNNLYELIRYNSFTSGRHHGKNRSSLPLTPQEFMLAQYLIPQKNGRVYAVQKTPSRVKDALIRDFTIDQDYYDKKGLIVIYSDLLKNFLETFYSYERREKVSFPLSTEVPEWLDNNVDLQSAVIIPLLLSDGGVKPKGYAYISGESKIVHSLWCDAWWYKHNMRPSSYMEPHKSIFLTTHIARPEQMKDILGICKGIKKSPYKELKEDYLGRPQPTIAYLLKRPSIEQQIALRIWANTEGSIGIHFEDGLCKPAFQLACANPSLARDIQKIAGKNNVNLTLARGKTWSGIDKLRTTSIKSVINFLKIGGFIPGTRVNSKSKHFQGLDKQKLLLGILEFTIRQRVNELKTTSNKAYKEIRRIVINKEYRAPSYYINLLGKIDNWSFRR